MELMKRLGDLNSHGVLFSIFISISILLTLPMYLAYPPLYMATGDSVNPQPTYQLSEWFLYALIILLPVTTISLYAIDSKKHKLISSFLGLLFLLLLVGVLIFNFSAFLFNFAQDWSIVGILFKALIIGQFIWTLFNANDGVKRVYVDISGYPPPKGGTMVSEKSRKGYSVKHKSNIGKQE